MKLTPDFKPYMLRKELSLPRDKCRLSMHVVTREASTGVPGYSHSFGWPMGDIPPEFGNTRRSDIRDHTEVDAEYHGVYYDPADATLSYKPCDYLHIYFELVASKVPGLPPKHLKVSALVPENGKWSVQSCTITRPKDSDEISTADVRSAIEDIEFNFEVGIRAGAVPPDWLR